MDIRRDSAVLQWLLWAMAQPRTFYILGAGASYNLAPTMAQISSVLRREYLSFGMYPVRLSPSTSLHDRIIGNAFPVCKNRENLLEELLLRTIQRGALELLVQKALCPKIEGIAPRQYTIFDAIGAPSTLFSFNLDGLAHTFCSYKHVVLEPHGRIDRVWFDRNPSSWLEIVIESDIVLPHITPKLLPSPEPNDITQNSAYQQAPRLLQLSSAVVIIGYSFGKTNEGMDDLESWHFFLRWFKACPRPIFVLSPNPNELVEMLSQALLSHNVFGLSVYWEVFSNCLLVTAGSTGRLPDDWRDEDLKKLIYRCDSLLEGR